MGILSATGASSTEGPEDVETDEPAAPEPEAAVAPEPDVVVPASALQPKTPGSRRWKAEEAVNSKLAEWEARQSERESRYLQQLAEQREELARMRGALEERRSAPQPVAPAAPRETPEDLERQANAALDAGSHSEYQRLMKRAYRLEAEAAADEKLKVFREEIQRSIPKPIDPQVTFLINSHPNVAKAGARGIRAVQLKDEELEIYGMPRGPERVAKAFELANQALGSQGQREAAPKFSQQSGAALSAIPTARPAGNGEGGEGFTLTPLEVQTAKAARMTPAEYVKWKYPERFNK